jgi:hypothetical protein
MTLVERSRFTFFAEAGRFRRGSGRLAAAGRSGSGKRFETSAP